MSAPHTRKGKRNRQNPILVTSRISEMGKAGVGGWGWGGGVRGVLCATIT